MSVANFSRPPVRAIYVLPDRAGRWSAIFRGDEWTREFTTAAGERWLVLDAVTRGDVRNGLPIVVLGEFPQALREPSNGGSAA